MRSFRAPLILASALAAAALTGCGPDGAPESLGATPSPGATYSISPDTPMNDLETVEPTQGTGGGDDGNTGGGGNDGGSEHTGPWIEYFRVAEKPTCPSGTNLNPIEGTPVKLEWKVTGADAASISIDGPGLYGTYEPEKSDTFPFSCGGPANSMQTHTYLLKTVGGGEPQTKEITVSARVNEITIVGTAPSNEATAP
jgi:hypothetical protein